MRVTPSRERLRISSVPVKESVARTTRPVASPKELCKLPEVSQERYLLTCASNVEHADKWTPLSAEPNLTSVVWTSSGDPVEVRTQLHHESGILQSQLG